MSALSVFSEEGVALGCAYPIYLTSEISYKRGAKIAFEVLERDASYLKRMVGEKDMFGIDPQQPPFFAEVTSLELCDPTELALQMLGKPVMCGVLTILEKVDLSTEN